MTRRDAMSVIGVGASAGILSMFGRDVLGADLQRPDSAAAAAACPPRAIIRTLRDDLAPDALAAGPTLFQEHLSVDIPVDGPPRRTADIGLTIEEARRGREDGLACIVGGGHPDANQALRWIAFESGLPIVARGGYYTLRTHATPIAEQSVDAIAADLVREAAEGHLGAYGEIGPRDGELTADEKRVFEALGSAQARNGLPIFVHGCSGRRQRPAPVSRDAALRLLDILEKGGGRPACIAIGHACGFDDPKAEAAIALAKRGAFVGLDRVTLMTMTEADCVIVTMALAEAGYADRLLLTSGFDQAPLLGKRGGPRLAETATVFGPMLIRAGMPEVALRQILVDNSRRFLAFVPKI
jgi:predicted metal-dependent phosphotriesterase family hydrolase